MPVKGRPDLLYNDAHRFLIPDFGDTDDENLNIDLKSLESDSDKEYPTIDKDINLKSMERIINELYKKQSFAELHESSDGSYYELNPENRAAALRRRTRRRREPVPTAYYCSPHKRSTTSTEPNTTNLPMTMPSSRRQRQERKRVLKLTSNLSHLVEQIQQQQQKAQQRQQRQQKRKVEPVKKSAKKTKKKKPTKRESPTKKQLLADEKQVVGQLTQLLRTKLMHHLREESKEELSKPPPQQQQQQQWEQWQPQQEKNKSKQKFDVRKTAAELLDLLKELKNVLYAKLMKCANNFKPMHRRIELALLLIVVACNAWYFGRPVVPKPWYEFRIIDPLREVYQHTDFDKMPLFGLFVVFAYLAILL